MLSLRLIESGVRVVKQRRAYGGCLGVRRLGVEGCDKPGVAVKQALIPGFPDNPNSENLAAFAFHRSSLLMAARGVDSSGAAEAGVEVENIVIPDLNMPVQFRRWYDPDTGYLKYSVGLLYGVAVGNDMGVRVLTA
jgi:hypothetical protein